MAVKTIDTKTPELDYINEVYGMRNSANIIDKAVELEIFELLYEEGKPVSAADLAKKKNYRSEPLERFLNYLTSLKLVVRTMQGKTALYCNSATGNLLSNSHPDTLVAVPKWNKHFGGIIDGITDSIKESDKPVGEEEDEDWSDAPAEYWLYQGFHNVLQSQAKALVTCEDLKQHKSCLDLGGGTGVIAFELKRQYPDMDVTVFEIKNVVKLAEERFVPGREELGVKFMVGDFFKTEFPKVDLFIVSRVLRNMAEKDLNRLITKCYDNLNPGGAMLCFEQMMHNTKDSPVSATMWDIINMTWNAGIPTPNEYTALFNKHGFKHVNITFTQDWNEYDIIYAKKS